MRPSLLELWHDLVFGQSICSVGAGPNWPVFFDLILLRHINCHLAVSNWAPENVPGS
jgi:hypothetical protein